MVVVVVTVGCDDITARIRRYVEHNPDAGVMDVLGALTLSPEHRRLVESVLGQDRQDPGQQTSVTDGERDPSLVESSERSHLGNECPACGTLKTTENKAVSSCVGEDEQQHFAHSTETAYPELFDDREYYVPTALGSSY